MDFPPPAGPGSQKDLATGHAPRTIGGRAAPPVDRIPPLSRAEFLRRYGRPGIPVVLEGAAAGWPASALWTRDYFRSRHGQVEVEVYRPSAPELRLSLPLARYLDALDEPSGPDEPYYLGSWCFGAQCADLLRDFQVPGCFAEDWVQQLPQTDRPDLRWLFIGPAGSGTRLHVDVAYTSAWNAVVSGRKLFVLYPPEQAELLIGTDDRGEEVPADVFAPDLARFPRFGQATPRIAEMGPGDVVFTPSGWVHQVLNLEECVSLTQNYVDETNYRAVREALRLQGEPRGAALLRLLETMPP